MSSQGFPDAEFLPTHSTEASLNMCYLGSAEETVYGRLLQRLQQANLIVGVQQISLLPVEPQEFRDLQVGNLSEEELTARATERLRTQRRNSASMEMTADEQYEMYHRMSTTMRAQSLPAGLGDFWKSISSSSYLAALGANAQNDVWTLPASEDRPCVRATIRRDLISDDIQLATWGNPQMDALVDSIADQLPEDCQTIRRISTAINGRYEIIGYVISTIEGEKLITSIAGLEAQQFNPAGCVREDTLDKWREALRNMAQEEIRITSMTQSIHDINCEFAKAQQRFVLSIAIEILQGVQNEQDRFWKAISEISDRNLGFITIPSDGFEMLQNSLMFATNISGDKMHVPLNAIIQNAAIEIAEREAGEIKGKKSDVTTEEVIRRLRRQIR